MSDVLVLCYHAVSDDWPDELAVRPGALTRQLESLVAAGYVGATFRNAVSESPAERTLAVTFDDAYRSVLRNALPVLDRLELPGTIFVPTDSVDAGTMTWRELKLRHGERYAEEAATLSWDELSALVDAGWEVGSHSRSHPHLPELDDAELDAELAASKRKCESRLGVTCVSFAYPYGEVDARVARAVGSAGYEAGAALAAKGTVDPLRFPRIDVYRKDQFWRFRFKVSRSIRSVRRLR